MRLDVFHIYALADSVLLVDIAQVVAHVWVVGDALDIALEVNHIDFIKAHQGHEQANVRLRQSIAD